MEIKLIASDFDGTIFTGDYVDSTHPYGAISPRTQHAIDEFKSRGGKFVLCTGRMFKSIIPFAQDMKLDGEIVAQQGAGTYDMATLQPVARVMIPPDLLTEFLEIAEKDAWCQIYDDERYYIERKNCHSTKYAKYTHVNPTVVDMPLSEFVRRENRPFYKVYASIEGKAKDRLAAVCQERFNGRLLVSSSQKSNIEAVSALTSKSKALDAIAKRYGITRKHILAFGDALNDLDMIEYAGTGVAVADADPVLFETADIVTDKACDDGVARIIEELCLK
ncbi:MAG: HAD family hydrolase [Clostridiaceae bacterium]|nr:HAD family hydrolase [Clostridiaceae bacterium]